QSPCRRAHSRIATGAAGHRKTLSHFTLRALLFAIKTFQCLKNTRRFVTRTTRRNLPEFSVETQHCRFTSFSRAQGRSRAFVAPLMRLSHECDRVLTTACRPLPAACNSIQTV